MHFLKKGDVDVSLEVSGEESDLAGADHWIVVQERTCVPGKNSDRGMVRGDTVWGRRRSERRDRQERGRYRR